MEQDNRFYVVCGVINQVFTFVEIIVELEYMLSLLVYNYILIRASKAEPQDQEVCGIVNRNYMEFDNTEQHDNRFYIVCCFI